MLACTPMTLLVSYLRALLRGRATREGPTHKIALTNDQVYQRFRFLPAKQEFNLRR